MLAAGYFLLRVVWHAVRLPSHVRAFRERRRDEKGRAAALGAIQALFEGQFVRAEKLASGAAGLGATPGLASLLAARAAQRLRQFGRRDQWLERAKEGDGEWRLARLMTADGDHLRGESQLSGLQLEPTRILLSVAYSASATRSEVAAGCWATSPS